MKKISVLILFFTLLCIGTNAQNEPRREFRGAWVHTVGNGNYKNMTVEQMKQHFINLLDDFKKVNINAVIFQVRPQADAFYISDIEPWSRFITGTQGVAPQPVWDPLAFMVEECHKRGMELHAWFNPYRVTSNDKETLCQNHLYYKKPYLFLKYGKQIYFDPGQPEAREHTVRVIADVVSRYDIDAVHFDDYFYPYKIYDKKGKEIDFPDDKSFAKYRKTDGFKKSERNNWRRNNVNILVEELSRKIKEIKPWVKFGISPFGVWRNVANDPTGSQTKAGCQNYDDLYADIKLWVKNRWIDYNVPQLYWDIGHPAADYETLIYWWAANNYGENLYIGQSISQTVKVKSRKTEGAFENQLPRKMELVRSNPDIHGNVWWPGYAIPKNPDGFTDSLKKYQSHIALMPRYKHIDTIAPAPVKNLDWIQRDGHYFITWQPQAETDQMQSAVYFCIYKDDEIYPTEITRNTQYEFYINQPNGAKKYRVTALDRLQNESAENEVMLVSKEVYIETPLFPDDENDNTTINTQIGDGLEIYLLKENYISEEPCYYCFKPKKKKLQNTPIITENDILEVDWKNQKIHITNAAAKRLSELKIPMSGLAAALTLNGKPVYGLWMWNSLSSNACDYVCAMLTAKNNEKNSVIEIKFGLPNENAQGKDPRYNKKLYKYLNKKHYFIKNN